MKKMICALLALAMILCAFAMAETIAPQFTELNTADATYSTATRRLFGSPGKIILTFLKRKQSAIL